MTNQELLDALCRIRDNAEKAMREITKDGERSFAPDSEFSIRLLDVSSDVNALLEAVFSD